ncbi:CASTOR/POLLUX-related putative ion channel [Streptomyces sp. NBC_01190]|uniref:CASTOR/POLLUX-related putative ion channel n=1 Tax=Streptomyces sp. NBC_01190 TaxID=2903767 RepID=UPI003862FA94|nr:NAD-binding lipoprotein [Streptomyces sp. NBC_01190]
MARGTPALLGWLLLLGLTVVVPASVGLVWAERNTPATRSAQLVAVWQQVTTTLRLGGAVGPPVYVVLSVLLALVTLFFVSTLVSVITSGLDRRIMALRLGRSTVLEKRHTVLLGWSEQVFPVLAELVAANANRRKAVVAILSARDKVGMEEEIHTRVGRTGTTRVICRNGSVTDPAVLVRVSPQTADAVVVLTHGTGNDDALVVRTLLALNAAVPDCGRKVVAAVRDGRHHLAATLAAGPGGRVLNIDEITARLIVQTSRQPGLSLVYLDLLDFAGDEFYTVGEPALVGRTFGEALLAYATSSVVGLVRPDGTVELNPVSAEVIGPQDQLVVISRDDDTAVPAGHPLAVDETAIAEPRPRAPAPKRLLLLGWNRRAPMIVDQLGGYVDPGSVLDVVARRPAGLDEAAARRDGVPEGLAGRHLSVVFHRGDIAEPHVLNRLDIPSYDRVIVLGYDPLPWASGGVGGVGAGGLGGAGGFGGCGGAGSAGPCGALGTGDFGDGGGPDDATLVTLLHLRALEDATGQELSVVTELTDDRNRLLAPLREGADFIVSGRLISLLMTQISQNRHLADLFDRLLTAGGSEIHLKPASDYVRSGREVTYATVVESARRRHHCAIGYRLQREAPLAPAYGVYLNPDKRARVLLGERDWLIVLAER